MSFSEIIKDLNKKVSREFAGTHKYWMRSPSNILLYNISRYALAKYVKSGDVLDAGAGKLAYKELVSEFATNYTSSDFQKTHPDLDVETDIEEMSFKDKSFDAVFCSQVLEHVPHPWKAMKEIRRVLKANGVAVITVPMLGYIHNAPYDFYRYTEYGLETLAKDAGFSVLELKPVGGFFCFLGYVFSTAIMPLYGLPVFGIVLLYGMQIFHYFCIWLDRLTKSERIFPLNYLLVLKK